MVYLYTNVSILFTLLKPQSHPNQLFSLFLTLCLPVCLSMGCSPVNYETAIVSLLTNHTADPLVVLMHRYTYTHISLTVAAETFSYLSLNHFLECKRHVLKWKV